MVKTQIEAGALQRLAEVAATEGLNELGIKAECVYLGQATGPESNRAYILGPREWIVEGGVWASWQTIAFEWRWGGGVAVVEQRCDNAQQRGVRNPTEDIWCKGALDKLNTAAKAFADMHGRASWTSLGFRSSASTSTKTKQWSTTLLRGKLRDGGLSARWFSNCRYLE